jgi:hypothetical protein
MTDTCEQGRRQRGRRETRMACCCFEERTGITVLLLTFDQIMIPSVEVRCKINSKETHTIILLSAGSSPKIHVSRFVHLDWLDIPKPEWRRHEFGS